MESPLGLLFAIFFMAELENNTIPFLKPEESPLASSHSAVMFMIFPHSQQKVQHKPSQNQV